MESFDQNIRKLHIIRGLAALLVVIYHSKFILWSGGSLYMEQFQELNYLDCLLFGVDMLSSCGKQCVLVFFILSGFVIHYNYGRSNKSLPLFYLIRAVRIYLPYLFSVVLSIGVLLFVVQMNPEIAIDGVREYNSRLLIAFQDLNFKTIFNALIFVPAQEYPGLNFAYWSLLHEGIFYVLYPLYFMIGKKARLIVAGLFLGLSFAVNSMELYYQVFFLLGVFLCDFYQSGRSIIATKNSNPWLYFGVICVGYIATNGVIKVANEYYADLAAVLTILVAFDYIIIKGIKKYKLLTHLADISFSLYLNHLPVLLICYYLCVSVFGELIIFDRYPYYLSVIVSIIVCQVIYLFTEKQSLVLIKKIKSKWN